MPTYAGAQQRKDSAWFCQPQVLQFRLRHLKKRETDHSILCCAADLQGKGTSEEVPFSYKKAPAGSAPPPSSAKAAAGIIPPSISKQSSSAEICFFFIESRPSFPRSAGYTGWKSFRHNNTRGTGSSSEEPSAKLPNFPNTG